MVLSRGCRNPIIPLLAVLAAILPLAGCTPGGTLLEGAAVEEQAVVREQVAVGEQVAVRAERRMSIGIASVSIVPKSDGRTLRLELVCAGDAEVVKQWAPIMAAAISGYDEFVSFRTRDGEPLRVAAPAPYQGRINPIGDLGPVVGSYGDAAVIVQPAYIRLAELVRSAELEVVWGYERHEIGDAMSEDGIAFYFHGRERPVPVMMPARFESVRDGQK